MYPDMGPAGGEGWGPAFLFVSLYKNLSFQEIWLQFFSVSRFTVNK